MTTVPNGNSHVDFIGSGWAFPLRVNSRGGLEMTHGERDIEESIRIILSTPTGERRMRPEFGCGVHDLAFATNDPTTHGLIQHHVLEALALWEPRVAVTEVRVENDEDEPSRVLVEIDYTLRATNDRRNLVYPFYIIPGERE
jgi:phage baseplate assembly protein W